MIYTIEFELPDNETVIKNIKTARVSWGVWGYSGVTHAQPQRTGRWIHDGYAFKGGIDWMHCSECGHKDRWSVATRTPFCGWCGAKMEGEG